jgi:hypothetical protein
MANASTAVGFDGGALFSAEIGATTRAARPERSTLCHCGADERHFAAIHPPADGPGNGGRS